MPPSWQARLVSAYFRLVIRRRHLGDAQALATRARRRFWLPTPMRWLASLGLRVRNVGARGEWVSPPRPDPAGVVMYFHGGGYVACTAAMRRPITAAFARATGQRVFSVDYRLAPESPFPVGLEDALAVYRWMVTEEAPGVPVAIAGESAGGGLVFAIAQHARDHGWPMPSCIVAFSPWTDLTASGASVHANDGRDALFRPENMADFAAAYLGNTSAADPRASPLLGQHHAMPPVLIQVGATELLLDDSRRLHDAIVAAGGDSQLDTHPTMPHAWQILAGFLPEADASVAEAATFIRTNASRASRGT